MKHSSSTSLEVNGERHGTTRRKKKPPKTSPRTPHDPAGEGHRGHRNQLTMPLSCDDRLRVADGAFSVGRTQSGVTCYARQKKILPHKIPSRQSTHKRKHTTWKCFANRSGTTTAHHERHEHHERRNHHHHVTASHRHCLQGKPGGQLLDAWHLTTLPQAARKRKNENAKPMAYVNEQHLF